MLMRRSTAAPGNDASERQKQQRRPRQEKGPKQEEQAHEEPQDQERLKEHPPKRRRVDDNSSISGGSGVPVRQVILELGEMEERFHREAQQQRRAVESSHLEVAEDKTEDLAHEPIGRRGRAARAANRSMAVAARATRKGEEEEGGGEVAVPKGREQVQGAEELTMGGIGEAGGELSADMDETVEVSLGQLDSDALAPARGAERPPAVNSAYLPLPWKGRLGYVQTNTTQARGSAQSRHCGTRRKRIFANSFSRRHV